MAPIDNGEDQMQRVTADVSREATRATARLVTTSGSELARAMAKAAAAIRAQIAQQRNHGRVSINKLEELSNGRQRDLVTLEDKEVVRELERSLNRRGVSYAIERDTVDGQTQYILHIQGKDANIVADSLERASAMVDARRDRQQGTPDEGTEPVATPTQTPGDLPEPAPVHAPEPGQAWAPQPDMSDGKSLKAEMTAKMEAAEAKHLQSRAAAQPTRDAPARGALAEAAPKKTEAAKPVSVREKVKLRADTARSATPKPNLDAPARGGVKR